jgi:glycosyltransferase involved in cell wall biosynthesis
LSKVLTIIVPAYNVERFLPKTLASFVAPEVMDDLEIIVVNDGSNDATEQIAQEYQHKYPKTFRVISKENGGHGSTINKGIELATGRYFKVVDGDDWVDPLALIKLVQFLKTSQTDVVLCNSFRVNHHTGARKPISIIDGFTYNHEYQFAAVFKRLKLGLDCMTIRTKILQKNRIRLDEHCFYVDMEYFLFPVPFIKTVVYLNVYLYMYRIGTETQSIASAAMRKNLNQHSKVLFRLIDFLNEYKNVSFAEPGKVAYIAQRIAQMYTAQIRIYLSQPFKAFRIRKELLQLESRTKDCCAIVYAKAGNAYDVKLLRVTHYFVYQVLHFGIVIYKMVRMT